MVYGPSELICGQQIAGPCNKSSRPAAFFHLIPAAILFMTLRTFSMASGPGTTSADFLKIPVGARAAALGSAYTAISDDALAIVYNPGGLAGIGGTLLSLEHNKYFDGMSHQWLGFALPVRGGGFGLGINRLGTSRIDAYSETGTPDGSVDAYDISVNAAYGREYPLPAHNFIKTVSPGVNIKYLRSKLADTSASGFGADAGVLLRAAHGFKFGLMCENLVETGMKFVDEKSKLERRLKVGASWSRAFSEGFTAVYGVDLVFQNDGKPYAEVGIENRFNDVFSVRVGYEALTDFSSGLTAGFGFDMSRYLGRSVSMDYSFTDGRDLGNIVRFGFSYRFPGGRSRDVPTWTSAASETQKKSFAALPAPDGNYTGKALSQGKAHEPAGGALIDEAQEPHICTPAETPLAYYEDELGTASVSRRISAAMELGEKGGEAAVALLVSAFDDPDAGVRTQAARSIGRIGGKRSEQALIALYYKAKNRKAQRLEAVRALGSLRGKNARRTLLAALKDSDWEVRRSAATALGKYGDKGVMSAIRPLLRDKKRDVAVAAAAVLELLAGTGEKRDAGEDGTIYGKE